MMRGTTLISLRRFILGRLTGEAPERGVAMLTAILFMIIMAGVSTVILGVVTTQAVPSNIAQKGTKTIYSAQAGIQAALAVMRSSGTVDGSGNTYGDKTKIPCSLSGTPNSTADGNAYSVAISYYTTDPTPHATDTTWLSTNKIACNVGTYGTATNGPITTPKFALMTSSGTATQIPNTTGTGNRSITAVYEFQVKNVNVLGGLINNTGATACMQAVSATAGSQITFVNQSSCGATSTNAALQLWSYTPSWQLALSSTTLGGVPGLCITGSVSPTPPGNTWSNATLVACAASGDPTRWNQLWSWTGSYTWEGELSDISGPNSASWLTPAVADGISPIGTFLRVSSTAAATLAPTQLVGAGGAKYSTHQLVNYQEFGYCADVTNEDINHQFQISYPCKQDPTGGTSAITWNQKWIYCEATDIGVTAPCTGQLPNGTTISASNQEIYVYQYDDTTKKNCLTTPLVGSGSFYPYFTACAASGSLAAQQTWSRVYNTGNFLTSYIITDNLGRCLEANSADLFLTSPAISKLWVATCDGQNHQKWNAVPTYIGGTVGGYREISGG
jgi:hypothetical protein